MLLEPGTSAAQQTKHKEQTLARETRARANGVFMDFWNAYPPREGENPREPARKSFEAALQRGAEPAEIIRGAENYARSVANIDNRRFVAQAVTWLNQKRWEDHQELREPEPPQRKRIGIF